MIRYFCLVPLLSDFGKAMFVDTHCHMDDSSFTGRLPEIIARADAAGVGRFIVPGVGPAGWDGIMTIAAKERRIFAAPGVHPLKGAECCDEALGRLELLTSDAVAIGEIGLDYSYPVPREVQQHAFRAQLGMAVSRGLPVILHCRRAFADLLRIFREERGNRVGGVMHAFSGSPETALECIRLGLVIGVAGPVTYANAVRPAEVVRRIPLDRILLETDAPDLAPFPYRGMLCEPAFLPETARKVAAVKGVTVEEVARVTTVTAERLFMLN